jgi:serine O-acetyltransferase
MKLIREVVRDAVAVTRSYHEGPVGPREIVSALTHDGLVVLITTRLRGAARRRKIPLVNGVLRRIETMLFGIEIGRDVTLGEGVVFLHTHGIVIGGDAQIGDRVVFLGSNTVGSIGHKGYPRIGNDVVIGAGARILGPVTIGDRASIGANAVVVKDVPAGATAVGVPAVIRSTPGGDVRTGEAAK